MKVAFTTPQTISKHQRNMENKTQRYALFCCQTYYPEGGLYDLKATSDDIAELKQLAETDRLCDWFHIAEGYEIIFTAEKKNLLRQDDVIGELLQWSQIPAGCYRKNFFHKK
jgi:hypothetical protein